MRLGRRNFVVIATAALVAATAAYSDENAAVANVLKDARERGYDVRSVRRTLLNRVRIVATREGEQREIVVDPRNGVILRDHTRDLDDNIGKGNKGGSSYDPDDDDDIDDHDQEEDDDDRRQNDGDDDDDDDRDDDDDKDDDRDNSGSGSDNSGSGSGNSGSGSGGDDDD
ncbi:MAG: hypothetical protein AAFV87_08980 [Pseudomonadota bacterium]